MGYEMPIQRVSFPAGADLSAKLFFVGALDSSGNIVVPSVAAAGGIGVIQEAVASGRTTSVMTLGISKCVYGGAVLVGDKLTNDANGKLVKATTATDYIIGTALEAGAAGEQGTILIK